jgi:hypothetical protein
MPTAAFGTRPASSPIRGHSHWTITTRPTNIVQERIKRFKHILDTVPRKHISSAENFLPSAYNTRTTGEKRSAESPTRCHAFISHHTYAVIRTLNLLSTVNLKRKPTQHQHPTRYAPPAAIPPGANGPRATLQSASSAGTHASDFGNDRAHQDAARAQATLRA